MCCLYADAGVSLSFRSRADLAVSDASADQSAVWVSRGSEVGRLLEEASSIVK